MKPSIADKLQESNTLPNNYQEFINVIALSKLRIEQIEPLLEKDNLVQEITQQASEILKNIPEPAEYTALENLENPILDPNEEVKKHLSEKFDGFDFTAKTLGTPKDSYVQNLLQFLRLENEVLMGGANNELMSSVKNAQDYNARFAEGDDKDKIVAQDIETAIEKIEDETNGFVGIDPILAKTYERLHIEPFAITYLVDLPDPKPNNSNLPYFLGASVLGVACLSSPIITGLSIGVCAAYSYYHQPQELNFTTVSTTLGGVFLALALAHTFIDADTARIIAGSTAVGFACVTLGEICTKHFDSIKSFVQRIADETLGINNQADQHQH
ncbi:MAG: hypothetical protein ACHP6I_01890 [Rickettsiales bacterium]